MSGVILVTGATGFVGRHVLKALAAEDKTVRLIVRRDIETPDSSGRIERVIKTPNLFSEDVNWWADACAGVDTIIHLAWFAEPGAYLQSPKNVSCLAGTLNLAQGAVLAGVRRFVGIGTCFEYELSNAPLTVTTPLRPLTLYAAAKASAFLTLSQWCGNNAMEFAWCRLFYLYGEGEDTRRLVPHIRLRLSQGQPAELSAGQQVRDFLDVAEAGHMIAKVALGSKTGPLNICSGVAITVRQLAEKIADEFGRRDLLKFGARPDNLIDPPFVVGARDNVLS